MVDGSGSRSEVVGLARDAYVCFFPMLMGYRYLFGSFLVPDLPSHMVPLNTLGGQPQTLDHTFKDVITPNADTPYSMAGLDLRAEPMVLSVPAIDDRFYHFQFEDLWGHNVHYVGTKATGTGPGTYLLAGPGWDGDAPADVDDVLRFETDGVFVIGRTQLLGPDDVDDLGRIMAAYDLRLLSTHTGDPTPETASYDWPVWNDDASVTSGSSASSMRCCRCVGRSTRTMLPIWSGSRGSVSTRASPSTRMPSTTPRGRRSGPVLPKLAARSRPRSAISAAR